MRLTPYAAPRGGHSHRPAREDAYRLSVGLVGAEAMLRLFVEEERNERAFEALSRFLSAVDAIPARSRGRAALDPVALGFQLKLLWLSGYLPHLASCASCGEAKPLVGFSARAGGAVCGECSTGAVPSVSGPFALPPLPYAFDALEPYLDARTMELHHDQHHGAGGEL